MLLAVGFHMMLDWGMRISSRLGQFCLITTGILTAHSAMAQIPANPLVKPPVRNPANAVSKGGFDGGDAGATIRPSQVKPSVQQTTYITLGESRQWTSVEGKVIVGKLIAFEQSIQKTVDENAPPPDAAQVTVVREGKARLLVKSKPVELALDRLSEPDRAFIEKIREGIAAQAKKAAPPK